LWAGTTAGLFKVDVDRGEVSPYLMGPEGDGDDGGQAEIHALTGTQDGSLWIGSELGLYRMDPEREAFEHFRNDRTDPWSLADDEVVALAQDRSGLLWVGTHLGGVDRADITQPFHYFYPRPEDGGLDGSKIICMAEISPNRVLIGTRSGGLDLWDRTLRTLGPFDVDGRMGLPAKPPMAMLSDRSGGLWSAPSAAASPTVRAGKKPSA
ncbi:MAG: two-component regulator propeller domain-containing protein, partial [Acidobacteriota bacterium]